MATGESLFVFQCGDHAFELKAPEIPQWAEPVAQRLADLASLSADWDSYGASSVDPDAIAQTIELLLAVMKDDTPVPTIVPTNRGRVMVEWHTRGVDLEVTALPGGRFHVSFEENGDAWDETLSSDLSRLDAAVSRLARPRP